MGYRELIRNIKEETGYSEAESEEALNHTVECIAERLHAEERMAFANQLPVELQEIALLAERASMEEDIVEEFMETYAMDETTAKQRLLAGWRALRRTISSAELRYIRSQFSQHTAQLLY